MKRFIIFLCILMMIPIYSFATPLPSPSTDKMVFMHPQMLYAMAERVDTWPFIKERLEAFDELCPGYILLDAVKILLDAYQGEVEWWLSLPIKPEHELQVVVVDPAAVYFQDSTVTEDGTVIIDFTGYEPGFYFICFYIKPETEGA